MINLADILGLMLWSDLYRAWTVEDIGRMIIPPLNLGQFTFIGNDDAISAFATWAFLTEEAERGFVSGDRVLFPEDWNSGDRIWLMDAIALQGQGRQISRQVRETLRRDGHRGQQIKFFRDYGDRKRLTQVKL